MSGWKKLIEFLPADTMKLKALEYAVENDGSTDLSNQTDIKQFLRKAGILSSKYGLHSKAINYYKTLIQIVPISNSTHVLIAEQYYLTKDLEGLKNLKSLVLTKKLDLEYQLIESFIYALEGNYQDARDIMLQNIDNKEYQDIMYYYLFNFSLSLGQKKRCSSIL